jgi:hypothetical protein
VATIIIVAMPALTLTVAPLAAVITTFICIAARCSLLLWPITWLDPVTRHRVTPPMRLPPEDPRPLAWSLAQLIQ